MTQKYATDSVAESIPVGTATPQSCHICENLISTVEESDAAIWDQKLVDTGSFVAAPTVGALVEGYVLTLPKSHVLCAGALPPEDLKSYWEFTSTVREQLDRIYGGTVIFEHGPSQPDTSVGCGVDHAHFHIAPIDAPLKEYASQINPEPIDWHTLDSIVELNALHVDGTEYLLYQNQDQTQYIGTAPDITSQLFRKAIAKYLGISNQYDWKTNPREETVAKTFETLQHQLSNPAGDESEMGRKA